MQLCYSCRHAFPASSLSSSVFSEIISHRFEEVQNVVKEMEAKTPEENHRIVKLQTALRELCSAVHQEIGALKEHKANLEAARQRDRQEREIGATSRLQTAQSNNANSTTQISPQGNTRIGNTNFNPKATFNGTVPVYKLRKMNSSLELVSACIYTILESLAIRTRSAVALLWLPPPGVVSTELVAPFIVGRDMSKLRTSAPYRVSETSIPCVVSETGIAVNLQPKQGTNESSKITENSPLIDLIEASNSTQLLVPVFTRYGEIRRTVLGVIHLFGTSIFPCPFSLRDEEAAVQTAATLSIVLSSYHETMGGEWANRIYDPSLLISTSAYQSSLDMRSTLKGLDDFAPPPTLIFRCVNERKEDDDVREVIKTLKHAMVKKATPKKPVTSIKDLHRFATSMENNWVSVLKTNSAMEARMAILEEKALQAEVERGRPGTISTLDQTSRIPSEGSGMYRLGSSYGPSLDVLPPVAEKKVVLRAEQIDEIEIAALRRLQNMGVDTTPFITQRETENV